MFTENVNNKTILQIKEVFITDRFVFKFEQETAFLYYNDKDKVKWLKAVVRSKNYKNTDGRSDKRLNCFCAIKYSQRKCGSRT